MGITMPRTLASIEKMSDEKLDEMLDRLSAENAKRELVSPISEQVSAIATAVVQSVLGEGYVINKRRGRVPGTKVASRTKRAARERVANSKVSRKKKPA
jgi:hypothetical protein